MTPEGKVKARVKAVLKAYAAYYHMPVQNGMGAPALDFMHIQIPGVPVFAVETKAPGKVPTVRQEKTIADIRRAGGTVFVIDGSTEELEQWLAIRVRRPPSTRYQDCTDLM
jgi:hypothetical protein